MPAKVRDSPQERLNENEMLLLLLHAAAVAAVAVAVADAAAAGVSVVGQCLLVVGGWVIFGSGRNHHTVAGMSLSTPLSTLSCPANSCRSHF